MECPLYGGVRFVWRCPLYGGVYCTEGSVVWRRGPLDGGGALVWRRGPLNGGVYERRVR